MQMREKLKKEERDEHALAKLMNTKKKKRKQKDGEERKRTLVDRSVDYLTTDICE